MPHHTKAHIQLTSEKCEFKGATIVGGNAFYFKMFTSQITDIVILQA